MKKVLRLTTVLCLGGGCLVLLVLCLTSWKFGGWEPLKAYLNGEVVYLAPKTLSLGDCETDAETVAIFKMANLASKEVSVVGEHSSCDCAFSDEIPIFIPSGKTVDLKVNVRLPKYNSSYDQTLVFMVAEPSKLGMHPVRVTATISNPLPRPIEETESVIPLLAPIIEGR